MALERGLGDRVGVRKCEGCRVQVGVEEATAASRASLCMECMY